MRYRRDKTQRQKKGRKRWKTILPLCVAAVLCLGATTALLYDLLIPKTNAFSLGQPTVDIPEEFDGWNVKKVYLQNVEGEDAVPGVARAMIVPVLKDKNTGAGLGGELAALSDPTGGTSIVLGDFTFHLAADWQSNWFYSDGYFYCRKVLAPGETSAQLLEKVSLTNDTEEMRQKYKDVTVEVEVMSDIIQAAGGAPQEAWGVSVNGNTVSPSS